MLDPNFKKRIENTIRALQSYDSQPHIQSAIDIIELLYHGLIVAHSKILDLENKYEPKQKPEQTETRVSATTPKEKT